MGAGSWTESEDQIVRREHAQQEKASSTTSWDAIARCLPGRTSRDVRKRWVNVLENQFHKGAWTKSEDEKLRIAVQQHGTVWVNVAKGVGTRSADQCSKRWNQHLNPALVHSEWTKDKIGLLFRAVSFHGTNWSTIQQLHFPQCSSNNIKNQHAIVSRNYERLRNVLASIFDAPPCCQNGASCSQDDAIPDGIMTPPSNNTLWNLQPVPLAPEVPDAMHDYTITSIGSPGSDLFAPQLDILNSTFPSETTLDYSTAFDPGNIQEAQHTTSSIYEEPNTEGSSSPREVSLVIQNPDEQLLIRMVHQLVTAKVDFKVVQGSD